MSHLIDDGDDDAVHVTDEHLRRGDILRQEAEIEGADDERALALGLETDDVTTVVHSLTSWAVQHGTRIDSLAVVRPNLEDTFLRLTDGPDA